MPNQLIVLCDGTDESYATDVNGVLDNVQLLRQVLSANLPGQTNIAQNTQQGWQIDLSTYDDTKRYVYYDVGLGTSLSTKQSTALTTSLNPATLLKDAEADLVAEGMVNKIIQAYTFLVQHYTPGDQIFLFGFSRGAYTLRLLISAINYIGLIDQNKFSDPAALQAAIKQGFALYRSGQSLDDPNNPIVQFRTANSVPLDNLINFYGAWECVPGPEAQQFYEQPELSSIVTIARHALAIDESRPPYAPQIWVAPNTNSQQLWYPGSHEDVGGGYADHGLANGAFQWLVGEAVNAGLYVVPGNLTTANLAPNALAPQHNSSAQDIISGVPVTWAEALGQQPRTIHITPPDTVNAAAVETLSPEAVQRYGQTVSTIGNSTATAGLYEPANLKAVLPAYYRQIASAKAQASAVVAEPQHHTQTKNKK